MGVSLAAVPAATPTDDESLMRGYLAGDARAFDGLFGRLAPKVGAFFRRSFDASAAEELVQATFLQVHRSRAGWRPGSPVRPWVLGIAAHLRRDELRRRYRLREDCDEDALEAAEAASAAQSAGAPQDDVPGDRVDRVREALARLPESQRVIVHLHRYEELTFAQIAEVLGTSPGAVRVRAFRAYERLRADLADLARVGRDDHAA